MGKRTIGLSTAYYDADEAPRRTNRTGADTVLGGTYFVDLDGSQAESQTSSAADPVKSEGNIVASSTARIAVGVLVIAKDVYADDTDGRFVEGEGVETQALVDGTTDVAAGDPLKAQNAGTAFIKATAGSDRFHAIALEAVTANAATLARVLVLSTGRK